MISRQSTELKTVRQGSWYRILTLQEDSKLWVILRSFDSDENASIWKKNVMYCWCENEAAPGAGAADLVDSVDSVIAEVTRRADLVDDVRNDPDPLTYFPKGWTFWGHGIPHPILAYRDQFIKGD